MPYRVNKRSYNALAKDFYLQDLRVAEFTDPVCEFIERSCEIFFALLGVKIMACFNAPDHDCTMLFYGRLRVLRWSNGERGDADMVSRADDITDELSKLLVRKCRPFDLTFWILKTS